MPGGSPRGRKSSECPQPYMDQQGIFGPLQTGLKTKTTPNYWAVKKAAKEHLDTQTGDKARSAATLQDPSGFSTVGLGIPQISVHQADSRPYKLPPFTFGPLGAGRSLARWRRAPCFGPSSRSSWSAPSARSAPSGPGRAGTATGERGWGDTAMERGRGCPPQPVGAGKDTDTLLFLMS